MRDEEYDVELASDRISHCKCYAAAGRRNTSVPITSMNVQVNSRDELVVGQARAATGEQPLRLQVGYTGSRGVRLPYFVNDFNIVLPTATPQGYV